MNLFFLKVPLSIILIFRISTWKEIIRKHVKQNSDNVYAVMWPCRHIHAGCLAVKYYD